MKRLYTRELILIALFAALISIGASIAIPLPFTTVPITMQLFFVMLAGAVLRPFAAGMSVLIYVAIGTAGVPVFARGEAGIGALIGATGGYLVGFILAAIAISWLVGARKIAVWKTFLAMIVGMAIVYDVGMIRLAQVASLSIGEAFAAGVVPFLIGDTVKAVVASIIAAQINKSGAFQTTIYEPVVEGSPDSETV